MCARYSLLVTPVQFQFLFGFDPEEIGGLPAEFRPGDRLPALGPEGARTVRWGIQVGWSRSPLINARSEGLEERRTFGPLLDQRLALPATCFYEWRGGQKFRLGLGHMFALAALHDGERAAILTREATVGVKDVHDRMPVVLTRETQGDWLRGGDAPPPPAGWAVESLAGQPSLFGEI